jgi:hypothetical protein
VMTGEYARPRERRPDIPAELEQLILHAMALEPEDRPHGAEAIEHVLIGFCRASFREHAGDRSGSAIPRMTPLQTPMHPTPPPREKSRVWLAAGVIGAVVLAVGGFVLYQALRDDTPIVTAGDPPKPVEPVKPAEPVKASAPPAEAPKPADSKPADLVKAPETIVLKFDVEPAGATISVDGKPMPGDTLTVPRDGATHRIKIAAPGYAAREDTIKFDENQRLVVQLRHVTGKPTPAKPNNDRIESESPYK